MKSTYSIINKHGEIEEHANEDKKNDLSDVPVITDIGLFLLIPILGGIWIGQYLDSKFDQKPFFTILSIIVGVICAFYNLFSIIKKTDGTKRNSTTSY